MTCVVLHSERVHNAHCIIIIIIWGQINDDGALCTLVSCHMYACIHSVYILFCFLQYLLRSELGNLQILYVHVVVSQ